MMHNMKLEVNWKAVMVLAIIALVAFSSYQYGRNENLSSELSCVQYAVNCNTQLEQCAAAVEKYQSGTTQPTSN
jgi:hypothetical protein